MGTAVTLDSTATVSDGGTLSYEWFVNTVDSTDGGTSLGITTATYAPPTDTAGTHYYYCTVTNTNDEATES